jgi:hypothetical protein
MPIDFRLGSLIAFMLVGFFHLSILCVYLILNRITTNFPFILDIIFWIYFAIMVLANIRTSRNFENILDNPNLILKPVDNYNIKYIKIKYVFLGFIWRIGSELHYIKKTANLDFK